MDLLKDKISGKGAELLALSLRMWVEGGSVGEMGITG